MQVRCEEALAGLEAEAARAPAGRSVRSVYTGQHFPPECLTRVPRCPDCDFFHIGGGPPPFLLVLLVEVEPP